MNTGTTTRLIGLGCASPASTATQRQAADFAAQVAGLQGDALRFAETIYRRSGVSRRASALLHSTGSNDAAMDQTFFEPRTDAADAGPSTGARMRAYAALAPPLAATAAQRAMIDARPSLRSAEEITHLVTVSCTGFAAPGIDIELINTLGLATNTQRTNIGFMGCHGGLVGLRTAHAIAAASAGPANVLLVCVELCSLHLQYTERPDQLVANALFADGAAAVVLSNHAGQLPAPHPPRLRVHSSASTLFPNSLGAMSWTIADHGFEMTLAESVRDQIRTNLAPWLEPWLASSGLSLDQARTGARWAVHPGGPRIIDAVGQALALPAPALAASRGVLNDHGNMSSPSVLFILDRLLRAGTDAERSTPIIMLGFGPGLTAEAVLLSAEI